MELLISLFIGIGLSATSGFRLFVPFLIVSIASLTGYLELSSGFDWIGSYEALTAFAIAAAIEILAYFFPIVDNFISVLSAPLAVIAGTIITASVLVDIDPMLTWSLAVIGGGGASLAGKTTSTLVHTGSTTVSGGTANPLISFIETIFSFLMAILSIIIPVIALIFVVIIVWIALRFFQRHKGYPKSR